MCIDYRVLLKKYMNNVSEEEGVFFEHVLQATKDEQDALNEISEEFKAECKLRINKNYPTNEDI